MPVSRRETEPDKSLLLDNEHGAQHYPFHETVHRESLNFRPCECRGLEPVGDYVCSPVQEQSERVGPERAARHSVGSEIFEVLDPQLHSPSAAIPAIHCLRLVVAVAGDYEADTGPDCRKVRW